MTDFAQMGDDNLVFFDRLAMMTSNRHTLPPAIFFTQDDAHPKLNMNLDEAVVHVFLDMLNKDPSAYKGFDLDCSPSRVACFVVENGFDADTGKPMKIYTSVMDGATWNGEDEGVMTLEDTEGLINHIIETHHVETIDVDTITMTGATLGFLLGVVGVLIAQLIGSML